MKTKPYFYDYACCLHLSVTKTLLLSHFVVIFFFFQNVNWRHTGIAITRRLLCAQVTQSNTLTCKYIVEDTRTHILKIKPPFFVDIFLIPVYLSHSRMKCVTAEFSLACSRLSVSEDDRKSERATSRISGERDPGEKRRDPDLSFFPTRPHSSPARFFNPSLTESLEQAKFQLVADLNQPGSQPEQPTPGSAW